MRSTNGRGNPRNARVYRAVILLVSAACGGAAIAQTNNPPVVPTSPVPAAHECVGNSTNVVKLAPTTVVGKLDAARNQIVPDLGATTYTVSQAQIAALPQGENAPFNQVLLRAPGMAQDSAANGDLHLRGEHANIQYRINDVLLPEGITGFGQELDTRFVDSMRLITGSLPAQYGFRTAGVVDMHTKSGAFEPGGEVSVYGGSYDTIKPSFELGGSKGKLNYFVDGSYNHNGIGIENPTPSATPIHDDTDQYKAFTYLSYVLDDTSRISVMGSASYADFQVPNTPGLPAGHRYRRHPLEPCHAGAPTFDSAALNENQNEQNYYAVVAYQKSAGDLNLQVAGYGRVSTVHFTPDPVGDLFFNGVASDVDRKLYSGGLQADASYKLGEKHTLRGGVMVLDESLSADTTTTVFPVDANGNPTGTAPSPSWTTTSRTPCLSGVYLQDEWKILPKVTLNYGARFDLYYASFDKENQPSPRVNLIYQPTDATTLHAGYARYFTPPPLENVPSASVAKFNGTSNAVGDGPGRSRQGRARQLFRRGHQPEAGARIAGRRGRLLQECQQPARRWPVRPDAHPVGVQLCGGQRSMAWSSPASYTTGGFSTYANVAYSVAQGKDWNSAQFLFDPDDAAYVQNHWIYLDHDQRVTGSFGASYLWKHDGGSSRFYVDALYGSGLQDRCHGRLTVQISRTAERSRPITRSAWASRRRSRLRGKEHLKARLDVVNITDNVYQLRNGSGVGVNAAQYGMRLGFFGTLSYVF